MDTPRRSMGGTEGTIPFRGYGTWYWVVGQMPVGCNFSVTAVTMDDVDYQNRLSWRCTRCDS
jgi:hypothetical protein